MCTFQRNRLLLIEAELKTQAQVKARGGLSCNCKVTGLILATSDVAKGNEVKQQVDTRFSKENDVVVKVISMSEALKCIFIKLKEYHSLNLSCFSFSFFSSENILIGSLDPMQVKKLLPAVTKASPHIFKIRFE